MDQKANTSATRRATGMTHMMSTTRMCHQAGLVPTLGQGLVLPGLPAAMELTDTATTTWMLRISLQKPQLPCKLQAR